MKAKSLYRIFFLFTIFACLTPAGFAQLNYWKAYFPGYDCGVYKVTVDPSGDLNLALNNDNNGLPNKFISLNGEGLITFSKDVSDLALLNFRDSAWNRYLVTYTGTQLGVSKLDQLSNPVWNQIYSFNNPYNVSGVGRSYFLPATEHLFTANGKLALCGMFEEDQSGNEAITLLFIDTANGNLLASCIKSGLWETPMINDLMEDSAGNINIMSTNVVADETYVNKISQTGTVLISRTYGDLSSGNIVSRYTKGSGSYFYIGLEDVVQHFLKLDRNLDTVYNVARPEVEFQVDFIDANDSNLYIMSDKMNILGQFYHFDFNGNLYCTQGGQISYYNFSYRFFNAGQKTFSFREALAQADSCNFTACSPVLDGNAWNLMVSHISAYWFNKDNYYSEKNLYVASKTISSNTFAVVGFTPAQGTDFSGTVFFDANQDCIYDPGDVGLPNQLVKIDPLGYFAFTNDSGFYQNYLDTGQYTLSVLPFNSTLNACPANIALSIADTSLQYPGNNLGIQDQAGNLQDLGVTINQTSVVPGQNNHVFVSVKNFNPLPASGVVSLQVDTSILTYITANPAPDSISGNTYYWHADTVGILDMWSADASFYAATTAVLGDTVTSQVWVQNILPEPNLTNNYDIYQGIVVSSFDPNEKLVYPKGSGSGGNILPTDTLLKYKIRFQNTGTFMAYQVRVIDTLDASFDISTFRLLSTSHPCRMTFKAPNVLIFMFDDIMLPDSGTDELHSHGFINCVIELKNNLPYLTVFRNKAYIYFDYNDPVATNETINTIGATGIPENHAMVSFTLFPNPATGMLTIKADQLLPETVAEIIDLQGRVISTSMFAAGRRLYTLDVGNIKSGFYLLGLKNKNFRIFQAFIRQE